MEQTDSCCLPSLYQSHALLTHDLRGILAILSASSKSMQQVLPELLKAYDKACQHHLVPASNLNSGSLIDIIELLEHASKAAQFTLNLALANCTPLQHFQPTAQALPLATEIEHAVSQYVFSSAAHRQLIDLQLTDLQLSASPEAPQVNISISAHAITYMIWNLLQNALYAIQKAGHGRILIELTASAAAVILTFTDTAGLLSLADINQIYEPFYSQWGRRGLGLYFIKNVLQATGAGIDCQVDPGSFTKFIINFPKITSNNIELG